jgi:hypothetical protein
MKAMMLIDSAEQSGTICNADFKRIKDLLNPVVSTVFEHALDNLVLEMSANGQKESAKDYIWCTSVYSLQDAISAVKKLKKMPDQRLYQLVMGFVPLAERVGQLKSLIVKRAPQKTQDEKQDAILQIAREAGKEIKTCACCFRPIAVVHGFIAKHGFKRPRGAGYQTASCPGDQFPPLEVSRAGLDYILNVYKMDLQANQADILNMETCTQFKRKLPTYGAFPGEQKAQEIVHAGDPRY